MKRITMLIVIFVIAVCALLSSAYAEDKYMEHVLGFGFGLPYGGSLGLNYELGIVDYFAPTAGLGYLRDNVGWNVGARLYYPGMNSKFRVRATLLYGTNQLIEKTFASDSYRTEEGVSAGFGLNWRFRQIFAFDFDLFFIDADTPKGYEKKGSDVKFSVGFSRHW